MARKLLLLILSLLFLFLGTCAHNSSKKPTEGDCLGKTQSPNSSLIILDNSDKE